MADSDLTRILVFCEDPLVRCGLLSTLQEESHFSVLSAKPAAAPGLDAARDAAADVVVADYANGMDLVAKFHRLPDLAHGRHPKVLIVSHRDSEWEIRQALERGVRGYLVLGCELPEIVDAVRAVRRGMRYICGNASRRLADSVACVSLTTRETAVLRLVSEGLGNKLIARELHIAIGTVKSHLKAIFEKLGAKNRTEVATLATSRGLLDSPFSTAAQEKFSRRHRPAAQAGSAFHAVETAFH